MKSVLASAPAPDLHVNYRYMLSWARAVATERPNARILDFGCGAGPAVRAARAMGLPFFGADSFYGGSEARKEVEAAGMLGSAIREIRDGRIDFEDAAFDLILSNQVFEHVEQLDRTLSELSRILKKDGLLVCLFPTQEVVREAHCGVPFLHWLDKKSPDRRSYAASWHWAGSSHDKANKTREQWAADAVEWMDRYTFYRRRPEILREFSRYFSLSPAEDHYLTYRMLQSPLLRPLAPLVRIPPLRAGSRMFCRRFNGVVLVATPVPTL